MTLAFKGIIVTSYCHYASKTLFLYVIIYSMARANSQGLSPTALRAKRSRDKAAAMTPKRKARKAENQRIGQKPGSDLHHTSSGTVKRTSIAYNRATHTRGEV